MKNSERLRAIYDDKARRGLVDVKFAISGAGEVDLETVCGEALALHAAITQGRVSPLKFGNYIFDSLGR